MGGLGLLVFSVTAFKHRANYTQDSLEIPVDVERTMEHTQNVYRTRRPNKVGDSVMSVKQDSNIALNLFAIFVPNFGEITQYLGFFINPNDDFLGGNRIFGRYVIVDIAEPTPRFVSPSYFCHVRIRRAISSFATRRPFLESSMPLSTILSKANSRIISVYVASSGCCRITSVIFSLMFNISTSS